MNYRHLYHAGGFSDVFKHVLLITLLEALQKKSTPLCFLDTHAGIGHYSFLATEARKTKEYETGILPLLTHSTTDIPASIQRYIEIVKHYNKSSALTDYPGSPLIGHHLLRPQDSMILCELHPLDVQTLKQNFKNKKQVAI